MILTFITFVMIPASKPRASGDDPTKPGIYMNGSA